MRGNAVAGWVLVLGFLLSGTAALAQSGGLEVQVVEAESRRPLPDATVILEQDGRFIPRTEERTDARGWVRFPVLRAVNGYRLEIEAEGFQPRFVGPLRVTADQTQTLMIEMLRQMEERVKVTASEPVVSLDRKVNSQVFSDDFIADLPVIGRFYQNLLTVAPGVTDPDGDGEPNVLGARDRDFRLEVNGISNVDPLTGKRFGFVHVDSIESLEVIQAGAGVEFGRGDSFARILQKQGSNEFEGVFSFLYRSSEFDGIPDEVSEDLAPSFEWIQPALQVSGPIVRDKLWFRASHEYILDEMPVVTTGQFAVSTREQYLFDDQITWQATPNDKLILQYRSDPQEITGFEVDTRTLFEATPTLDREAETWSLTWTRPVSARLLVDTKVAYQRGRTQRTPTDPNAEIDCPLSLFGYDLDGATCFDVGLNQVSGPYNEFDDTRTRRYTIRGEGTWATRIGNMPHRLRFGSVIEDEKFNRDLDRGPTQVFERDPFNPFNPAQAGTVEVTAHIPRVSDATAAGISWAVFLEDQFKPTPYSTITIGARWDREEISSRGTSPPPVRDEFFEFQQEAQALLLNNPTASLSGLAPRIFTTIPNVGGLVEDIRQVIGAQPFAPLLVGSSLIQATFYNKTVRPQDIFLNNDNFALRVNAAWDPFKSGKTKISASWGRYYNKIFLGIPLVELEPLSTDIVYRVEQQLSNGVLSPFQASRPSESINPTVSTKFVDRDLRTPFQDEWSLRVEREIAPETSLRFSYVRRDFEDQFQDRDLNHLPADLGRCVRWTPVNPVAVIPADQIGQTIIDPFTFEEYIDNTVGDGDGVLDSCTGLAAPFGNGFSEAPDGRPDLYVQNPSWGEVLVIGNFNSSTYEAAILEIVRRLYRGWELIGSYTWSEAVGDAEDFDQTLGNELILAEDERGFLDFDQRHVVNLSATTITPWGIRMGARARWESGLPYSLVDPTFVVFARPPRYLGLGGVDAEFRNRFPTAQRNDQRNPSFWTLDLKMQREFKVSAGNLQLTAEVFNVFDDRTVRLTDITEGVSNGTLRFGRRWQLGMRYAF